MPEHRFEGFNFDKELFGILSILRSMLEFDRVVYARFPLTLYIPHTFYKEEGFSRLYKDARNELGEEKSWEVPISE